MIKLAPSLLSADFLHLSKAVDAINDHADIIHADVMDGILVPNISFGLPVVKAIGSAARKPVDVHLMIAEPWRYALKFAAMESVEMVSFHLEAMPDPEELLKSLRQAGVKAGLAVNPDFPLEKLYPFLADCDFVLVMGVYAGFSGQKFIPETIDRIHKVKDEIDRRKLNTVIETDGGVSIANIKTLANAGAQILVAGSVVFDSEDPVSAMEALKAAAL